MRKIIYQYFRSEQWKVDFELKIDATWHYNLKTLRQESIEWLNSFGADVYFRGINKTNKTSAKKLQNLLTNKQQFSLDELLEIGYLFVDIYHFEKSEEFCRRAQNKVGKDDSRVITLQQKIAKQQSFPIYNLEHGFIGFITEPLFVLYYNQEILKHKCSMPSKAWLEEFIVGSGLDFISRLWHSSVFVPRPINSVLQRTSGLTTEIQWTTAYWKEDITRSQSYSNLQYLCFYEGILLLHRPYISKVSSTQQNTAGLLSWLYQKSLTKYDIHSAEQEFWETLKKQKHQFQNTP